jgi:hypothetical protein
MQEFAGAPEYLNAQMDRLSAQRNYLSTGEEQSSARVQLAMYKRKEKQRTGAREDPY